MLGRLGAQGLLGPAFELEPGPAAAVGERHQAEGVHGTQRRPLPATRPKRTGQRPRRICDR